MIFVKGLRFRERQNVMCAGRKMTISIGLRIDWVWKHMNAWTYLTCVAKTWIMVSPHYRRGNLWCFV